jgi:hypothetical protein
VAARVDAVGKLQMHGINSVHLQRSTRELLRVRRRQLARSGRRWAKRVQLFGELINVTLTIGFE